MKRELAEIGMGLRFEREARGAVQADPPVGSELVDQHGAYECVRKRVTTGPRRHFADQARLLGRCQRVEHFVDRKRADFGDQPDVELTTDDRRDTEHVVRRFRQTREPASDHLAHALR